MDSDMLLPGPLRTDQINTEVTEEEIQLGNKEKMFNFTSNQGNGI